MSTFLASNLTLVVQCASIYIALTQFLDRDVLSLKALCYGMTFLTTSKISVLLISSNLN